MVDGHVRCSNDLWAYYPVLLWALTYPYGSLLHVTQTCLVVIRYCNESKVDDIHTFYSSVYLHHLLKPKLKICFTWSQYLLSISATDHKPWHLVCRVSLLQGICKTYMQGFKAWVLHATIHHYHRTFIISPGCPRPSIALQVQNYGQILYLAT